MNPQKNRDYDEVSAVLKSFERREGGSVAIGIIATLVFHILLLLLMPAEFITFVAKENSFQELQIEILPPLIPEIRIPEFIEANPLANQLTPEHTTKESFQNQRAADEITDSKSKSALPYVEGEMPSSQKIVQGGQENAMPSREESARKVNEILERPLTQPAPLIPVETASASSAAQVAAEAQGEVKEKSEEKLPAQKGDAADPERMEDSDNGDAIQIEKSPAKEGQGEKSVKDDSKKFGKETQLQEKKKVEEKQTQKSNKESPQVEQALPAPKPRPSLSMRGYAGPLVDNKFRAEERGVLAVDSKFSEFGAYLQRMIEAIARQWTLLGAQYDLSSTYGTVVIIEYFINSQGELTSIKILDSNATQTGTRLCEQSILSTAPYGEWSEEMFATFGGKEQSVRITFHYR